MKGNKNINNKVLAQRKGTIAFLTINGRSPQIIIGKKAKNILKLNTITDATKSDSIMGKVVNKGVVIGKVKLILRKTDLKNLKNKIVVTPMTSIKFIPHLKPVKGIITDEGGIACHAAIISRELNIPCIVGTKNATKILKNGNIVKMDAIRGIIKIIKAN